MTLWRSWKIPQDFGQMRHARAPRKLYPFYHIHLSLSQRKKKPMRAYSQSAY